MGWKTSLPFAMAIGRKEIMPFHGNRKGQAPYSGSLSFSTVVAGYTKIEGVLVDRCLTKDGDAAEKARKD